MYHYRYVWTAKNSLCWHREVISTGPLVGVRRHPIACWRVPVTAATIKKTCFVYFRWFSCDENALFCLLECCFCKHISLYMSLALYYTLTEWSCFLDKGSHGRYFILFEPLEINTARVVNASNILLESWFLHIVVIIWHVQWKNCVSEGKILRFSSPTE